MMTMTTAVMTTMMAVVVMTMTAMTKIAPTTPPFVIVLLNRVMVL